jgi:fucose 4-O-acetylase-like acetyltransferase
VTVGWSVHADATDRSDDRLIRTGMVPPMRTQREPQVDLVRALAIGAVAVGHWLAIGITEADDGIDGINVLGELAWTHPLTWLLQVMPLFFFVAGYANAGSLTRHREQGGDGLGWVVRRYRRLVVPAALLVLVLGVAVVAARAAGVDLEVIGRGVWVATVPLWFLAVYLAVVLVSPAVATLQGRVGLAVPAACALAVAGSDLARFHLDDPAWTDATFVVAWLGIHQLGWAWHEGRVCARPRIGVPVAAVGAVGLLVATVAGPYPVSMVRVPGADLHNSEPPTLALLALALVQIGAALALRDLVCRWLQHRRPGAVVGATRGVLLSLFLWHMGAAAAAAVALHGTGLVPVTEIGSPAWLWWRLPWLAACAVLAAVLVTAVRPLERWSRRLPRGGVAGEGPWVGLTAIGLGASLAGMVRLAQAGSGVHGPLAMPSESVVGVVGGALLMAAVAHRSVRGRDRGSSTPSPHRSP